MYEYRLNVSQDVGNKQRLYVIQSGDPIPTPFLQAAGLILDRGISQDEMETLLPTARAYVSVVLWKGGTGYETTFD